VSRQDTPGPQALSREFLALSVRNIWLSRPALSLARAGQ
jgi:hypothetical protein